MTRISDQSSLEMFSNARWITEQLINRYKRLSLQIISIKRDSSITLKNLNDFLKTILLLFENVFRAKGMSFLLNSLAPSLFSVPVNFLNSAILHSLPNYSLSNNGLPFDNMVAYSSWPAFRKTTFNGGNGGWARHLINSRRPHCWPVHLILNRVRLLISYKIRIWLLSSWLLYQSGITRHL